MDEEARAGSKIAYSWQCDGASGRWLNPKEVMLRIMPWQYYVGTEVRSNSDGDTVIVKLGLKPHVDQAVRYLEWENEAVEEAKRNGRQDKE